MTTSLFEFVNQIEDNWSEVEVLLRCAESYEDKDKKLYDALCRSIAILIVAHMEGFAKGLVKSLIHDINMNCTFDQLPESIQRTYCKKYLGANIDSGDKSHDKKITSLIEKFSGMRCLISHEPFYFPVNKNPNPEILDMVFENFGIKNVFNYLHESLLDQVFSETKAEVEERVGSQREYVLSAIRVFPYTCNYGRMGFKSSSASKKAKTMWQDFLEQTNRKRHSVAHGNEFDNTETASILRGRKNKVQVLQLGLVELIAAFISSKLRPEVKNV